MYTRSMKSINDMTKHTTTSNFNSGTINGALVCCQINPICPAMSSRVPWNVSGSMVVVESLSILAYFFVSDEVMGNESLQYMWIYMRVSVYAWVIKGCVCVCVSECVALRKEHECFTILYELASFYFILGELLWFLLLSYAKAMWERDGFWVDSIISFLLKKQTHWLYNHKRAEREASYIQFKNTLEARYYVPQRKRRWHQRRLSSLLSSFCFCREKRERQALVKLVASFWYLGSSLLRLLFNF